MKKYLLLASVAGCLLASNAMAGAIAADGQSATVNVKVDFVDADTIKNVSDIDFGTLAITGELPDSEVFATISTAGVVTSSNSNVIISSARTPSAGMVEFNNSIHEVSITCASGTPRSDGACEVGGVSGLVLSNITTATDGKKVLIGGSLERNNVLTKSTYDDPTLKVTLQY